MWNSWHLEYTLFSLFLYEQTSHCRGSKLMMLHHVCVPPAPTYGIRWLYVLVYLCSTFCGTPTRQCEFRLLQLRFRSHSKMRNNSIHHYHPTSPPTSGIIIICKKISFKCSHVFNALQQRIVGNKTKGTFSSEFHVKDSPQPQQRNVICKSDGRRFGITMYSIKA